MPVGKRSEHPQKQGTEQSQETGIQRTGASQALQTWAQAAMGQ